MAGCDGVGRWRTNAAACDEDAVVLDAAAVCRVGIARHSTRWLE